MPPIGFAPQCGPTKLRSEYRVTAGMEMSLCLSFSIVTPTHGGGGSFNRGT